MIAEIPENNEIFKNESTFLESFTKTHSTLLLHGIAAIPGKIPGALLVTSAIEYAIPLIHGPVGCAFRRKVNPFKPYSPFYTTPCTNLNDPDVVDGGEDKLKEGIKETYQKYHPNPVSGTFDATIYIADVANRDSGQFDLSFDANVVNVTGVDSRSMDGTEIPIDMWRFIDSDTTRVIFNLPDTTGVSRFGSLATIHFTVTGTAGDTSVPDISDGLLVDIWEGEIPSTWISDDVTV